MRVVARSINKPKLSCLFASPNFTHQASISAKHILSALTVEPCHQFQISFMDSLYNAIRISSPQQLGKAFYIISGISQQQPSFSKIISFLNKMKKKI
jgi:hypothetical protein